VAGGLPSLTGLYSILMAVTQTLAVAQMETPNKRTEEINRILQKLS